MSGTSEGDQPPPPPSRGPVQDLASFAAALRARGMTVTSDQVGDMARSLLLVDPARRGQMRAALRSLAVTDPDQRGRFDEVFRRFFESIPVDAAGPPGPRPDQPSGSKPILLEPGMASEGDSGESETGASDLERLSRRDFAHLDQAETDLARHLVMTMSWKPSDLQTRRWVAAPRGRRPDLRSTFKSAVGPEGDLMRIRRRDRRLRQRPLIVIADVSGSMASYADMFLVFAHAAQRRLRHVEVFTFSTKLTRVTEDLRRREVGSALAGVGRTVSDWSGGTRIGAALASFNRVWSRRLAGGGPVALILSDGWDTGEPSLLAREIARLSRSVHRVIWLNPLAGREDYEPATRGMRAALPHVDHLLPAASVQDLRGVVRLLESLAGLRV